MLLSLGRRAGEIGRGNQLGRRFRSVAALSPLASSLRAEVPSTDASSGCFSATMASSESPQRRKCAFARVQGTKNRKFRFLPQRRHFLGASVAPRPEGAPGASPAAPPLPATPITGKLLRGSQIVPHPRKERVLRPPGPAVPGPGRGAVPPQVGIIYNGDGNVVSFNGSVNETSAAWTRNREEFDVKRSLFNPPDAEDPCWR